MTAERTYHCDGPGCERHWSEGAAAQAPGLLTVSESGPAGVDLNFCGWDCAMKYAARFPPAETIYPDDGIAE